jgi:diacylglycerol kinase (ATP)
LSRTKNLVAELADRGWIVDLLKASEATEVSRVIAEATAAGMDRLILAGGDGLLHHSLPALIGSEVTVGIVPVGTGNDFCRGLGLPTKTSAAIDAATGNESVGVDVIAIEAPTGIRYGATVVTSGFSGRVNARADHMSGRPGVPKGGSRYTLATLAELMSLEPASFSLTFDAGGRIDDSIAAPTEAVLIAVGNTRYFGGGMAVCPDARFDDGEMDVIIVGPVSKSTFARVLPQVFGGRHVRHPAVTVRRCSSLSITTSEPLWADGECLAPGEPADDSPSAVANRGRPGATTSLLRIEPKALTIAGARRPAA